MSDFSLRPLSKFQGIHNKKLYLSSSLLSFMVEGEKGEISRDG